jgi:adenylosuccinate lyase
MDVPGHVTACRHERGSIVDSQFFGNRYSTPEVRRIFCDVCRTQRWLDIEAALALAQAEIGMIPAEVAEQIALAANVSRVDLDVVKAETDRSGHSLIGLLRALRDACGEAGEFIHFGATTQDIQDTGQALEMRDVLEVLEKELRAIVASLVEIAQEHAATVALGRTHARPALPIGFGLKIASWIDELIRDAERIAASRPRILVAQLFGGAGTMAGFGGRGPLLIERFAGRLGLRAPAIGWHTARDRVVEFTALVAMVAGTTGRIAEEIRILGRPEFGEVEEKWLPGKVGSSTMPHKRNPERCEQIVVLARLAAAQAGVAFGAMIGDHERDGRSLRIEWACVPDAAHYSLAACAILREVVDGLIVHEGQIRANVQAVAEQVGTERLMFALGRSLGKQTAHEHVYQLSQAAQSEERSLRAVLSENPDLNSLIDQNELDEIFEPENYIGDSALLCRTIVSEAQKWLAST